MVTPDRQLTPPETNEKSPEYLALRDKHNQYNQLKWDYWCADKIDKVKAVRRLMRFIEYKMEGA